MDKTITLEMTKNEAEQLEALLDECMAAMDRAEKHIAQNNKEIELSQARTWAILSDLQRNLNVEKPS